MRQFLGLTLLIFQLIMIAYARRVPSRYFCWAPYDMQTEYSIDATVNGQALSAEEIRRRYRRPQRGVDNRSVQHVIDILEGAERIYHRGDRVEIVMRYRINGKPEQIWTWRRGAK